MVCILITGCGGNSVTIPTVAPTATVNAAATSTRTAELAQLATAQAPTATPLPTDTPIPPTATSAPTATPARTATPIPQATATRAGASATPRPATSAATSVSRAPLGAAPSGWKTYAGSARVPFAIYYPPNWKVDESSAASDGQVKFQSPTPGVSFTMQASTQKTTVSIDTLRDAQAKGVANTCKASGIEGTSQETYSGVIFDELLQTCDFGQPPLLVFGIAAGLNNGYPWTFFLSAPRDSIQNSVDTYFQPMLDSLRIYANPVG
jgi:hypothetical protein